MCKYGKSRFIKYDLRKNPIDVDIAKDLIKLRKQLKEKRKMEWFQHRIDRMESDGTNMYHGCQIFEKAMIDENDFVRNATKDMKNELKHLTQKEVEIITKLRTERINLNHYLYYIGITDDYKCSKCNVPETVDHYLQDCNGYTDPFVQSLNRNNVDYNKQRNRLKKDLRKISCFFKQNINFNTQNILFPHIWQRKLTGKNKDDKWDREGTYYRAQILKAVAKFVFNTKRFNDDYGI